MLGLRPQRGEINLRPRASAPKEGVGTVAQTFKRLCEPNWHERAFSRRKRLALRRANRNFDRRLVEIGVGADAGDRRLQASGVSNQRRRAGGDLSLKRAIRERRRQSAQSFDLLKEPPGLVAKRLGQRLERPCAGGGVGDKSEVGFAQENELGVASETPSQAVRKAGRQSVRQNADAVGAAEAGRERRRRAPHHIHVRIARRHHAPGALRLHMSRARLEAAGLLDVRPGDAQRAEFRQCRQFVRVGRQPERDQRAGFARRRPRLFKQTQ